MKSSESIKEISAALVKAQTEIKNLYPAAHGYGYNYVEISKIIDMLKEILPKYELSYIQLPCNTAQPNCVGLSTRIIHSSGEWLEDEATFPLTDMKGVNKSQACGAAITYARRYALCAAFGIAGDEDVDCNDKAFKTVEAPKVRQLSDAEKKELQKMKLEVTKLLADGAFTDAKMIARAKALLETEDYDSLKKCIDFAHKQAS